MFNLILKLVLVGLAIVAPEACREPDNKDALKRGLYKEIFQEYMRGENSFNIISQYRTNVEAELKEEKRKINYQPTGLQFITLLSGETKCRNSDPGAECPHYIVMDYDENREPQMLAMARCSCHRCRDHSNRATRATKCKPVMNYIPVIRRSCVRSQQRKEETYRYIKDLQAVPVGCTCMHPQLS